MEHELIKKSSRGIKRLLKVGLVVILFFLISSADASARSVTIEWDGNPDADYYIVYWGLVVNSVTGNSGQIGNVTEYTATLPDDGNEYYFAVKAFNNCGNSSNYSQWVSTGDPDPVDPDPVDPDPVDPDPVDPDPVDPDPVDPDPVDPDPVDPDPVDPDPVEPQDIPGAKDDDAFQPPVIKSAVATEESYPNIEVFDKNFQHLEWLKTGWDDYNTENGEARVAAGDIDSDGQDEIIIGMAGVTSNPEIPGGFFQVLDDDYSHLAWGRIEWADYNSANGETWPACGDIDGDGDDEIIIGLGYGGQGYIEVFDYSNGVLTHSDWFSIQWDDYNTMSGETRPVCADIDGDGVDEIISGLGSEGGDASIPGGKFEVFSNTLEHIAWGILDWTEYSEINGETWPASGDLDGDGAAEIVVGLGNGGNGKMGIFKYSSGELTLTDWAVVEWPEYNDVSGETRPVCGDIDSDGKDEIIVGLGPSYDTPEIPDGFFQALDDDLSVMEWGQIDSPVFNRENGESRPVKGTINGDDKIIIGLGSWAKTVSDDDETEDDSSEPDIAPAVAGAAGSSGCFINILYENR